MCRSPTPRIARKCSTPILQRVKAGSTIPRSCACWSASPIMRSASRIEGRVDPDPRAFLLRLFHEAVGAVSPARCVPPNLPVRSAGRTIVVGAGKAAAAMAKAVEDHWQGPLSGLVITRYGHGVPTRIIETVQAGHPVPDEAGLAAAKRMLALVQGLTQDDLVLALISGG